ncbi:MAG: hypothetical protein DRP02_10640 [Candidatus Gerdarchaeota archaeon]|nr:MAG: hypothetical protein DRP02_10640 [Candidatus Gerdarchaeota archaeon]
MNFRNSEYLKEKLDNFYLLKNPKDLEYIFITGEENDKDIIIFSCSFWFVADKCFSCKGHLSSGICLDSNR